MLAVVDRVLGSNARAVYLYGSAVAGGLRPASDLDLLVVVGEPTTSHQRADLGAGLRPISRRGERPADWRPVELTVVVAGDLAPLRLPPRTDFQYGEWLRDDFDAGRVDPAQPENPDLLILLAQVRLTGQALRGAPATEVIAEVPAADLKRAVLDSVEGLLADLDTDTTNVLLTLARIWYTLKTDEFTTKDAAAEWAAARISASGSLRRAAAMYRGDEPDQWTSTEARDAARELVDLIRG